MKPKGNSSAEKLRQKQHNIGLQILAYNREGHSSQLFSVYHNYFAAAFPHTTFNNITPTSILFAILLFAIARIACLAETAATSTDDATVTIGNTTTSPQQQQTQQLVGLSNHCNFL